MMKPLDISWEAFTEGMPKYTHYTRKETKAFATQHGERIAEAAWRIHKALNPDSSLPFATFKSMIENQIHEQWKEQQDSKQDGSAPSSRKEE